MALTESTSIDRVEIDSIGNIGVRRSTSIFRDSELVTTTYHRWTLAPGDDVSAMPKTVQDIAALVWTPEILQAYQERTRANTENQS